MDILQEKRLIEGIRNGDRASLRELYESCAPALIATIRRYVPDRQEAEDILQNSFIKIIDNLDRFKPQKAGSLQAWMHSISAHEAVSWLRKRSPLNFIPILQDIPEEEDDEGTLFSGIGQECIQEAIAKLPSGYRTVLNLYVFEDLSHKEIARLLGISEGTSASQLHRARAMLYKLLKEADK